MQARRQSSDMMVMILRRRNRTTTTAVVVVLLFVAQLIMFNVDRISSFPTLNLQTISFKSCHYLKTSIRRIVLLPPPDSIRLLLAVGLGDEQGEGSGDDDARRRKKKNKYNQFSKIRHEDIGDPLDVLIAESKQKVEALQQEILENSSKSSKWKRIKEELANRIVLQQEENCNNNSNVINVNIKLNFPDTKKIDPYDPTTFGYMKIGHVTGAHGVRGWIKVESSSSTTSTAVSQQQQQQQQGYFLTAAGIRHLKPPNKRAPRQVLLLQGKHRLHDEYLLQLQDVDDRNTAMSLRGSTLYAREEDTHTKNNDNAPLLATSNGNDTSTINNDNDGITHAEMEKEGDEEYVIADLVGLDVYLSDDPTCFVGKVRGVVLGEEMCSIPGLKLHDMLEIALQKGPLPSFLRDELVLIPFVPDIVPSVNVPQECILIQPPAGLLNLTYAMRPEKVRIKAFLPPSKEPNNGD
jgi:ribosomal 30S subunit maturation factor RimM